MGNDIFSSIMNKKKSMILEYANTFFRYTVDDKNKITKTLSSIIDIYLDYFYLNKETDFSDLNNYFSLQNSKDNLLKEVVASTIKFYQVNNIGDKIESYKGTIVVISNVIYLAINLCDSCFKNYDGNVDIIIEQFLTKYRTKIRVKKEEYRVGLENGLTALVKKDVSNIKKAFKLFGSTNYYIDLKKVLGYDNYYLVELNYDIKLLAKYSSKEIESAIEKNIMIELAIISLEQTILKIGQDYLLGNYDNKYFVQLPIALLEKQKYSKLINEIFKIEKIKKHIVFLFERDDVINTNKILVQLKENGFILGLHKINSLKINKDCFDNFDFVFTTQPFLEMYDGYQEIWSAKGIKFIIS